MAHASLVLSINTKLDSQTLLSRVQNSLGLHFHNYDGLEIANILDTRIEIENFGEQALNSEIVSDLSPEISFTTDISIFATSQKLVDLGLACYLGLKIMNAIVSIDINAYCELVIDRGEQIYVMTFNSKPNNISLKHNLNPVSISESSKFMYDLLQRIGTNHYI